jgi:hypothetical protein
VLFGLTKEVSEGHAQAVCELDNCRHARASLASLDPADVVAMDAGFQAQRLLRQPALIAGLL